MQTIDKATLFSSVFASSIEEYVENVVKCVSTGCVNDWALRKNHVGYPTPLGFRV